MGITPIELFIYKRKICFILQLIRNRATNELISNGYHDTLDDVIDSIGIRTEMKSEGPENYQGRIKQACCEKLKEIASSEKTIKSTSLVQSRIPPKKNLPLKHPL